MKRYIDIAKSVLFWLLILSIVITVIFIFSNSLKSPEASTEQSDSFGDFVATIIPPETELGGFIEDYLRKIAHFSEYGLLGIELALLIFIYFKKWWLWALASAPLSITLAVIDESLQYISERGPSVSDVWIDFGGFAVFSAITYGIELLVFAIILAVRRHRLKTEDDNG